MRTLNALLVPVLSVLTALALGAVVIAATGGNVLLAYQGLWEGSFGRPQSISNTLVRTTPYIFGGLSVALAFKAGLFNIGVEGQITMGALATAFVGYAVQGVPFPLHLVLAVLAGFVVGGLYGAIPGFLKATTGAHEVIVTIMLNYVAINVAGWLLGGPMKDRNPAVAIAQTAPILPSARLPPMLPDPQFRVHWGFVVGLVAVVVVWWLLQKTTLGFEIRTVGANANAARYAGVPVRRTITLVMALAGGLAGLAGAMDVVGLNYYYAAAFTAGYGFDSIAVALLARTDPFGIIPSALLFGGLAAGSARMQFLSQIPIDLIHIVQALVLIFVAAPILIRRLYRLPEPAAADGSDEDEVQISVGWSKAEP
jgi:simple sugar transport system permease protein